MAGSGDSSGDPMDAQATFDEQENMEQRVINEEYKVWKKNSVFLYDMLFSRALEWPTLTMQWFPDVKKVEGTHMSQHRILFGTHTSGASQNHLQIASIEIPDLQSPDPSEFDEQRGEIGGYGNAKRPFGFNIIQKINHPGEVNKARYEPQNPNVIASFTTDGTVLIFDRTKHSSNPKADGSIQSELELVGHTEEGYGLAWNAHYQYRLATGNSDTTVKTWDVAAGFDGGKKTIRPLHNYQHHSSIVNDVHYHPFHPDWLGSVSDDMKFALTDTRSSKVVKEKEVHNDAANCLAFHPRFETIFATGSANKHIALWDLRNLSQQLHTLEGHVDMVTGLEWHPDNDAILGSCGYDRRILFWDVSKVGEEQTPEEAEDGAPELLFMHGGFTNRITDFSWNKNDPWVMAAAAEDNQMQIFRPSRALVNTPKKEVQHQDVSD